MLIKCLSCKGDLASVEVSSRTVTFAFRCRCGARTMVTVDNTLEKGYNVILMKPKPELTYESVTAIVNDSSVPHAARSKELHRLIKNCELYLSVTQVQVGGIINLARQEALAEMNKAAEEAARMSPPRQERLNASQKAAVEAVKSLVLLGKSIVVGGKPIDMNRLEADTEYQLQVAQSLMNGSSR